MKILNYYFRAPVLIDYLLALGLCFGAYKLCKNHIITLPAAEQIYSMSSDLTTIGLTLAGFILTFLTVLITFKADNRVTPDNYNSDSPAFELFFGSHLYFQTIEHLKNATKSLIFLTVLGYSLKLLIAQSSISYLYYYNIMGPAVIALTLWRSLLILTKILKLQR